MLRQPLWKPLLFHDVDFGAILVTQLSRVVGIAQQAGIIRHYEGRQEIQQLLFRQVIVIAYPSVGKGLVNNRLYRWWCWNKSDAADGRRSAPPVRRHL